MIEVLRGVEDIKAYRRADLPEGLRVAHKTGKITGIHHDAAIVFPENSEPYVLVVLIEGVADGEESARLGAQITGRVHEALQLK